MESQLTENEESLMEEREVPAETADTEMRGEDEEHVNCSNSGIPPAMTEPGIARLDLGGGVEKAIELFNVSCFGPCAQPHVLLVSHCFPPETER